MQTQDGIKVKEVADYHIYPIADNDTPMLSSDRLEYTFSNRLGATEKIENCKDEKSKDVLVFGEMLLEFVQAKKNLQINIL